jgi:hypothetical protein
MDGRERDEDDEMTLVDQKDKDAPRQTAWVRAIVIEMFSKDQGWVSDDTNYGEYSVVATTDKGCVQAYCIAVATEVPPRFPTSLTIFIPISLCVPSPA